MNLADLPQAELRRRFRTGIAWRVGIYVVRVTTAIPLVAQQLRLLYAHFPLVDPQQIVDADISVRAAGWGWRRVSIYSDGRLLFSRVPRRQAVPLLEWTLNLSVFHRPSLDLLLHAAVVERGGRALLLPGEAGSGKSTLCAALIHRGWRLLSDEVAVIRAADGCLLPVPRPVSLKEESIEAVRRFAPQACFGPVWPDTPKGRLAHLLPVESSVRRMGEPAEPAWVVFPEFRAGTAAVLEPLPRADALIHCASNGFNYSVLGRAGFEQLAGLIDRCTCYELIYGDLAEAVEAVGRLVQPIDRQPRRPCAPLTPDRSVLSKVQPATGADRC